MKFAYLDVISVPSKKYRSKNFNVPHDYRKQKSFNELWSDPVELKSYIKYNAMFNTTYKNINKTLIFSELTKEYYNCLEEEIFKDKPIAIRVHKKFLNIIEKLTSKTSNFIV